MDTLKSNLSLLSRISIQTKLLCLLIILLYIINWHSGISPYIIATPANINIPTLRIWTLLTTSFVETNIILVIIDLIALLGSAIILEPIWGLTEFFIFLSLIAYGSVFINVMLHFILANFFNMVHQLNVEINGFIGVIVAISIALKQTRPDLEISLVPPISFRIKHIPFTCLLLSLMLGLLQIISITNINLTLTGFILSWIYLRFFQGHESQIRGDAADSFAFSTLFPDIIQPYLIKLGGAIINILTFLRLYRLPTRTYDVGAPSDINLILTGTQKNLSAESERRRQKAQFEIDQRLKRTMTHKEEPWPELLDSDLSFLKNDSNDNNNNNDNNTDFKVEIGNGNTEQAFNTIDTKNFVLENNNNNSNNSSSISNNNDNSSSNNNNSSNNSNNSSNNNVTGSTNEVIIIENNNNNNTNN